MKKTVIHKLVLILIILLFVFPALATYSQAKSIGDIVAGADGFIKNGVEDENTTIEDGNLKIMSDLIYNTLLIIAVVIAVIVGMIIGIQFMTGSVEQKAKIKETLIPYIAGCIVIFGAFGIWKLVVTIMSKV